MKKTLIFAVGLITFATLSTSLLITGSCWGTAIVQTTDFISFPVVALDSVTGVEAVPESIHVHVWHGSMTNTTVYSNREVCDGADCAQIDSVATGYAGAVPQQYYFHDRVQDIDGPGAAGNYTINVRLWRGNTSTSNRFSFQIVLSNFATAVSNSVTALDDSLGALKNAGLVAIDDSLGIAKQAIIAVIDDSLGDTKNKTIGTNTATVALLDDSLGYLKNQLTMAFDDDSTWGTNPQFTVERVFVRPEAGSTDAVYLEGSGDGLTIIGTDIGLKTEGGTYGTYFYGDDVGLVARGVAADGIYALGATGGLRLVGSGTNDLVLDGTGHISGWMDSVLYIESVSEQVAAIQKYQGAGDSWRQHLMPFGEANKDSILTFDGPTWKSTIYLWKDDSDVTIPDSLLQEIWE